MSSAEQELDLAAFRAWLHEHLGPEPLGELVSLIGGTQNQLFRFTYGRRSLILRLPPRNKRTNSDETMRREAQVLGALARTGVPHPAFVDSEPSTEVLGSAFVVMEAVDGLPATGVLTSRYGTEHSWRHAIGTSMAQSIARLGNLDPGAIGVDGLARPGSFLARQASRWATHVESYNGTPGYEPLNPTVIAAIAAWLGVNRPPDQPPGVVHGDYHAANVLLDPDAPGVAAIIDWELATVGDPLLDLGELLVTWPDGRGQSVLGEVTSITPPDGLASEDEMVAAYAAASDRDLSALRWYKVLAAFRLAAIIEGTWARACAGLVDHAIGRQLHLAALALLEQARSYVAEP